MATDRHSSDQSAVKVFVSYARADLDFADQLVLALTSFGYEPIIDRQEIAPGEEWQKRLGDLILAADTVAFVLSPESAASSTCAWEVAEAEKLGKRLIPVVCRSVQGLDVPQQLQNLNYIFFYPDSKHPGSGFWTGLTHLDAALKADVDWIRDQTRLAERAQSWEASGRSEDSLLRGSDLAYYQDWARRKPVGAADIPTQQRAFLRASEEAEEARKAREQLRLEEREHALEGRRKALARIRALTLIGLVGAVVLSAAALLGGYQAVILSDKANRQTSDLFSAEAEKLNDENQFDRALLYAISADPGAKSALLNTEPNANARAQLVRSYTNSSLQGVLRTAKEFGIDSISSAAFSPDGQHIVMSKWMGPVFIWNAKDREVTSIIQNPHDKGIMHADFGPDGTTLLITSFGRSATVWDTTSDKLLFSITAAGRLATPAKYDPSGRLIATATRDGTVELWDAETGDLRNSLTAGAGDVRLILFSPSGDQLLTLTDGETVRLWDPATGTQAVELREPPKECAAAAFSPNGAHVATACGNNAWIWDIETGAELVVLNGHTSRITSIEFSSSGRSIVTASVDTTVKLWRASNGEMRASFNEHTGIVTSARFNEDNTRILSASWDGTAKLWQPQSAKPLATFVFGEADRLSDAKFSPTGDMALTIGPFHDTVEVWKVPRSGNVIRKVEPDLASRPLISGDAQRMSYIDNKKRLKTVDTLTGKTISAVMMKDQSSRLVAMSRNGSVLLTTSDERKKQLWDIDNGRQFSWFDDSPFTSALIALNQDGSKFIGTDRQVASIHETRTGRKLTDIDPALSFISGLSFSDDGTRVALAGDQTLSIFEADTGSLIRSFPVIGGPVPELQFNPDGQHILTFYLSDIARYWEISTGRLLWTRSTMSGFNDAVQFSKDGSVILERSAVGLVDLFHARSGKHITTLNDRRDAAIVATFSADSRSAVGLVRLGMIMSWPLDSILFADVSEQIRMACSKAKSTGIDRFTQLDRNESALLQGVPDNPCDPEATARSSVN